MERSSADLLSVAEELARELQPGRRRAPLTLQSALDKDVGLDSLARVELLLRIEKKLGVSLPDQAVMTAETLADVWKVVEGSTAEVRGPGPEARGTATSTDEAIEAPGTLETLPEVLEWHAARHPDRVHIRYLADGETEEAITYGELAAGARRVAAGLRARGLEPGSAVAIMLPSGRSYFEAFFGAMMAGGVAVPLYPPTRVQRIEEHLRRQVKILRSCRAPALIAMEELKPLSGLLRSLAPDLREIATPAEIAMEPGTERVKLRPGSLAFLQYTSGSTGDPKGVMLTHANLLANIRAMVAATRGGSQDVFVSWLPLYHDMGLIGAWLSSLVAAITVVLMSPLVFMGRPVRWLRAISKYRGTLSAAPNFAYDLCTAKLDDAQLEGIDLSSWRIAFNGAEPVQPETLERFSAKFARYGFRREAMTPVYGLAENCLGVTFPPLERGPRLDRIRREAYQRGGLAVVTEPADAHALTFVSCGRPLFGLEVRVIDEAGKETADRTQGHVQFRGPSATEGYFANPEATRALLDRGWVNTGDLGYFAEGELFVTGRAKDMIIRGGRNIHPQELEEAAGNVPGIRAGYVAVFGVHDAKSGTERLVIAAETRANDPEKRDALSAKLRELATALLDAPPDEIVLVAPGSVPKTPSGKVRRSAARDLYLKGELGKTRRSAGSQWFRLAFMAAGPALGRAARATGRAFYAVWSWGSALALGIPMWLAVALLPGLGLRRAVVQLSARLWLRLTGIRVTIAGRPRLDDPRPAVLVVNHSCYLDSFVLAAVLPARFIFLAKAELARSFLTRVFLRRLDTLFAERFDAARGVEDARAAADAVRAGTSLIVYPEGTFRREPGLRPFHLGAFLVAAQAGVPLIPVSVRGMRSVLRDGTRVPRPGRASISVGEAIAPEGTDFNAAVKLRDAARKEILRGCGEPDLTEE